MSKAEVLKALHSLTLEEILEVIEAASQRLKQILLPVFATPSRLETELPPEPWESAAANNPSFALLMDTAANSTASQNRSQPRIPGQDQGKVWIADDFNEPLPKAVLTHAEVELVLQQPDTTTPLGLRDRAVLEILYSTGIRRAEVCSLRLDDIHVDRQVLYIHRGKGQKDRYVPIGIQALIWIARYVEQAREKLCIDPNEQTLFLTNEGKPLQPDSLT